MDDFGAVKIARRRALGLLAALAAGIGVSVTAITPAAAAVKPFVLPGVTRVLEGNTGTVHAQLPVRLSFATAETVTVEWTTFVASGAAPVQADPSSDYVPASGTVTFAPGETGKIVSIAVNGDTLVEPNEYFVVSFRNPTNALLDGFMGLGFVGITNDDATVVLPMGVWVIEGNSGEVDARLPVRLSSPSTETVTVQWSTVLVPKAPLNQAEPVVDYEVAHGTVTFAPGKTAKTVRVEVRGDRLVEPNEYIVVSFRNATNATVGGFGGLGFVGIATDE